MAQYFTDFSEYAQDTFPSDWTRKAGPDSMQVIAVVGSTGGQVFREQGTTGGKLSVWDAVGSGADTVDVEVLTRVKHVSGSDDFVAACLRVDTTGTGNVGRYEAAFPTDTTFRHQTGGGGIFRTMNSIAVPNISGDWWWVRSQVVGINPTTWRSKTWKDGDAEPATWSLEITDSESILQSPGFVGVSAYADGLYYWDVFGVGTNGDPAPTGPVSTGITGTATHQAQTATHSATGERSITGQSSHAAATATHSASGSVSGAITGTGSHQAATATHSSTGQLVETVVSGTGSHQAQPASHSATGIRSITGDSSAQAQTATHNAVAVRKIIASGTHSANDATHEATGSIHKTITGTGSHQATTATHEASSRPILLTPIKNTKAAVSQTVYKVKLTQIDYRVVAN